MLPGNASKRLAERQVDQAPNIIHERLALSREINSTRPAIGRIASSEQPPAGFQAVESSHETHGLKTGQFCQPHLTNSFLIGYKYQYFALG